MDIVLEVFPEPVATVDRGLFVVEANAAWQAALPELASGALPEEVTTAAWAVVAGRIARAEVDAPSQQGGAARYRWVVVPLPGDEPRVLVHARPLGDADSGARERELAEEIELLRRMLDAMPSLMFVKNWEGRFVVANQALAAMHGTTVAQVIRRHQGEVHGHAEETQGFLRTDQRVIRTGQPITLEEQVTRADGVVRWLETTKQPLVRRSGEVQVLGFSRDITEQRAAEQARDAALRELAESAAAARREADEKAALAAELDRRLAVIAAQHQEILALGAPILEMGEGAIGVPLIGAMDEARAGALTERLLAAIAGRKVQHVILDLTGIEAVDTRTADQLLGIVRAIALLGARAVITGIQPAVAQTMVELGADLSGIVTQRTPRDALRALAQRYPTSA